MNSSPITEDFDIMEVRAFNHVNAYGDRKPMETIKKAIGFTQLMTMACEVAGIDPARFQEKNRQRICVYARTLVSIYMQGHTSFALRTIGELTGGRDHASALHDKKRYSDLIFGRNAEWLQIESQFVAKLKEAYGRQYFTDMPDITKL